MAGKWWEEPIYGVHYTLREIDAQGFDTEKFVRETVELGFNLISFDSSGYHTTYPSRIPLNRRGPFIGDRDLVGEIMAASRKAGLVTQLCIDVGKGGTHELFLNWPEWVCRGPAGEPLLWTTQHGHIYTACPIGPYFREFLLPVVEEQLSRYRPDAMLLTDFSQPVCYCASCRRQFMEDHASDIPAVPDRANPVWQAYIRWRYRKLAAAWKEATDFCHGVVPAVKVVMNTVATFNDQIIQQGLAFDLTRDSADLIETEAQSKILFKSLDDSVVTQSPFWPTEQIRWLAAATRRPVVDHCSYFYAWPWRRIAVPQAYQKMWLLQVAVNGGHPIVHYVGPAYAQEDQRGGAAVRETGGILRQHQALFADTESAADVAVLFSQDTLDFRGDSSFPAAYEQHMRGALAALTGIPHDILSARDLLEPNLKRYKVLVLPNAACMSEETAAVLARWVAGGGGLVATGETSLFDADGRRRKSFLLGDLFGCEHTGAEILPVPNPGASGSAQNTNFYMVLDEPHPVLDGIRDTSLILCGGNVPVVRRSGSAARPLVIQPPYEIFPEGRAYGLVDRTDIPAALAQEVGSGRVVYFPPHLDRLIWAVRHPDLFRLLRNAVVWAARDRLLAELPRPKSVSLTARAQPGAHRYVFHLINATGSFPFEEIPAVENLTLRLRLPRAGVKFRAAISGRDLSVRPASDGASEVGLARLDAYEMIVAE